MHSLVFSFISMLYSMLAKTMQKKYVPFLKKKLERNILVNSLSFFFSWICVCVLGGGRGLLDLSVIKLKVNLAKDYLIRSFILFYPLWQVQFSWRTIILWKSLQTLIGRGSQNVLSMLGELVQRVSLKSHMTFRT